MREDGHSRVGSGWVVKGGSHHVQLRVSVHWLVVLNLVIQCRFSVIVDQIDGLSNHRCISFQIEYHLCQQNYVVFEIEQC